MKKTGFKMLICIATVGVSIPIRSSLRKESSLMCFNCGPNGKVLKEIKDEMIMIIKLVILTNLKTYI